MKAAIDRAADLGVRSVTIGMPHRGRLNVLGNVVRKPLRQIFSEFSGEGRMGVVAGTARACGWLHGRRATAASGS
jgi:2-oxoglutarate dehydrogenase E1 component